MTYNTASSLRTDELDLTVIQGLVHNLGEQIEGLDPTCDALPDGMMPDEVVALADRISSLNVTRTPTGRLQSAVRTVHALGRVGHDALARGDELTADSVIEVLTKGHGLYGKVSSGILRTARLIEA